MTSIEEKRQFLTNAIDSYIDLSNQYDMLAKAYQSCNKSEYYANKAKEHRKTANGLIQKLAALKLQSV